MIQSQNDPSMLKVSVHKTGSGTESPVPVISADWNTLMAKATGVSETLMAKATGVSETPVDFNSPCRPQMGSPLTNLVSQEFLGKKANPVDDSTLASELRARLQTLETTIAAFSQQLQALQQSHLQHVESTRADTVHTLGKLDGLQNFCHDTVAMEMQHAQTVLSIGVRMEVLEKQVARLLDGQESPNVGAARLMGSSSSQASEGPVVENTHDAAAGPSARSTAASTASTLLSNTSTVLDLNDDASAGNSSCYAAYDALKHQLAQTALKLFGQVTSPERQLKLYSRIGDEVQRAVKDIDTDGPKVLGGLKASGFGSAGIDKSSLVKQVEGLLQDVDEVEGTLATGILQQSPVGQSLQNPAAAGPTRLQHRTTSGAGRAGAPAGTGTRRTSRTPSPAQRPRAVKQAKSPSEVSYNQAKSPLEGWTPPQVKQARSPPRHPTPNVRAGRLESSATTPTVNPPTAARGRLVAAPAAGFGASSHASKPARANSKSRSTSAQRSGKTSATSEGCVKKLIATWSTPLSSNPLISPTSDSSRSSSKLTPIQSPPNSWRSTILQRAKQDLSPS